MRPAGAWRSALAGNRQPAGDRLPPSRPAWRRTWRSLHPINRAASDDDSHFSECGESSARADIAGPQPLSSSAAERCQQGSAHVAAPRCRRADGPLSGHHLVPRHRAGVPVVMGAGNSPRDPLAGSADRRDGPVRSPGIVTGSTSERPALLAFGLYALELWRPDALVPDIAFALGTTAAREWVRPPLSQPFDDPGLPAELALVLHGVKDHFGSPMTLQSMAAIGGRSVSTLHRLFRQHLHRSPTDWVAELRVDRADTLLSTTPSQRRRGGPGVRFHRPAVRLPGLHQAARASPTAWRSRRQVR